MKQNLLKSKILGKLVLLGLMMFVAQSSWGGTNNIVKVEVESKATGGGVIYVEPYFGTDRVEEGDNICYSHTGAATAETFAATDGFKAAIQKADYANGVGYTSHAWMHAETKGNADRASFKGFYVSKTECDYVTLSSLSSDIIEKCTTRYSTEAEGSENYSEPWNTLRNDGEKMVAEISLDEYATVYSEQDLARDAVYDDTDKPFEKVYVYAVWVPFVNAKYYEGPKSMSGDKLGHHEDFGTISSEVVDGNFVLTATPNAGFKFDGWYNAVEAQNGDGTMDLSKRVSTEATWTLPGDTPAADYYARFVPNDVHISAAGVTTYVPYCNLRFANSATGKAKMVEGVGADGKLQFREIDATSPCAADGDPQAYIIVGNEGDYTLNPDQMWFQDFADDSDWEHPYIMNNLLHGVVSASGWTIPEDAENDYYVLASHATYGVCFYKAEAGVTVPQYKAYLKVPKSAGTKVAYSIFDDEATEISEIENAATTHTVYNLAGQRVDESYKGVVIKNGKKFVNK